MFSNIERLLIFRFIFSKKTDGYISVFSWFSIIGIMIGVAAIIIVMSVMNGFREELTSRILGINGHLNIFSENAQIHTEELELIENFNFETSSIYPLIETQALLISDTSSQGVFLKGYDNSKIDKKHFLNNSIIEGRIFSNDPNEIIIGYALAKRLKLEIEDKIRIAIPKSENTIFGNIPRFKTLNVSGIFNLGMYEYDSNFVFTNSKIPRKLLMFENNNYNKIEIFIKNPNNIDNLKNKINENIASSNHKIFALSWKDLNAPLMNALKVEKNVMFLILTLIILVASMNIISGLIIFVKEKNKDIGILKTIGTSNLSLIKIFVSIGLLIGIIGTSLGSLLGIIISMNISSIQHFLEKLINSELFAKEIYYLSSLPSILEIKEVVYVVLISLFICLLATIFPAYRSSTIDPVNTLKND